MKYLLKLSQSFVFPWELLSAIFKQTSTKAGFRIDLALPNTIYFSPSLHILTMSLPLPVSGSLLLLHTATMLLCLKSCLGHTL